MTTMEIDPQKKLDVYRWNIWLFSCQYPKSVWNTPEEAQFVRARELTGKNVETTDWSRIMPLLKADCPKVLEMAITASKTMLGIETK